MYLRLCVCPSGRVALGALILGLSGGTTTTLAQSADELPPVFVETNVISQPRKTPRKAAQSQDYGSGHIPGEGTIIESANRAPMDAAKVGSSVSVVTEQDIENQSRTYLKDYLELLPGVNFSQNGPPGTTTSISVRGAYARYVKVLVDGMDISDPSGIQTATSFEHLLVGDVSRIELLKGSQSTLYGGDAVGGVITIDTKIPTKLGFSQSGSTEYGAYNTFRGNYTAGYATADGSNVSFTVQGVDTDGFSAAAAGSEDDGYTNVTVSGRGDYYISPSMKVFFAARTLDADYEYDGYPPPFYTLNDTADSGTTVQHAGRVGTEFSFFNGAFTNTLAVQGMKVERENYSSGASTGWYDGDRVKGEYKGILSFNNSLALIGGADWERTGADNANLSDRITADLAGVYAQLVVEPLDGLVLTGGGRVDDHSDFGQFNTYRLTGAYLVPGTETKLHASLGTGFRAPSLDELYGSYGFAPDYGNPDLEPEESRSWDAGVEQGFLDGKLRLDATYFVLNTDNLILYNYSCGAPNVPCNVNVAGTTHREGVELTATAQIISGLSLAAGYTYVNAKTADGSRLVRVPRHNLVLGLDAQPLDKIDLNVTAKYVTDSLDGGVALDDYVLVSAKAAYEFVPGWKAYVRGENLLDEDYETVLGCGTAGLSVFGGLQMALDE